jgi:CHAD domain-containing protein
VKETLERERKLSVDDGFELPPLAIAVTPRLLRATYHDTEDFRLGRHGITLRRRSEDGSDRWQLKLPAGDARLELEWDADESEVPQELAALLTAYVRGRPLRPIAELHTLRRAVQVAWHGRPAAEVVHDTVEVFDGRRVVRSFAEVEIEQLADGAEPVVARLERRLRAAGARRSDGRPKVFQALDLPAPRRPRPKRGAPAIEHLRAYLVAQVDALLRFDPAVRRGEPRGVHGMRVATRRMRSALRETRRLLSDAWVRETRDELDWLAGVLGDVRDADVFAAWIEGEVTAMDGSAAIGGADLLRLVGERSQPARARLARTLDSPRYLALLERLEGIAESLPASPRRERLERTLRRSTKHARRKLRRTRGRTDDALLHEARIATKRARYAAEVAGGALRGRAHRVARRAEEIQTILGEHQDAVVAEERLSELAAHATPAAAFVAGRLVERQEARREAARAALPKARKRFAEAARKI